MEKINELFSELHHPENHPIESRLVSKETVLTSNGNKPLIEIQPGRKDEEGNILELKFIRSKKPYYEFDKLIKGVLCYAKKKGYKKVKLEDDALFSGEGECKYRALFFRAFQNKKSLYEDKGFKSSENTDSMREILYNFTVEDAKELVKDIDKFNNNLFIEFKKNIEKIPVSLNKERFGKWIDDLRTKDCSMMGGAISQLLTLSSKIETWPNNIEIDNKSYIFLKTYRNYLRAHEELIQDARCNDKYGGSRSLRRTTHKTYRAKYNTRKSRKSRKYY
jgi:hypothetical protein